jgi:hypothetical protein
MSQSLCAYRHLDSSTPLKHAPLAFPEHSLCCLRSSMCSGGEGDHPAPADAKDTQTTALPGLHHVIDGHEAALPHRSGT